MKKLLISTLLVLSASLSWAGTTTSRIGIYKPADGETGWGQYIRDNFDLIDSTFAALGSSNTFTAGQTFLNDIAIQGGSASPISFLSSDGLSANAYVTNPSVTQSQLLLAAPNGIGINNNPVSGIDLLIYGGTNAHGSFAVVGSSADSSNAYLGFTTSGSIQQSTMWVLPPRDGTSGQVLETDGAGNLSFLTAAGTGDMVIASTQTVTAQKTFNSPTIFNASTTFTQTGNVPNMVVTSTGTKNAIAITENGLPGNSIQSLSGGALNITVGSGTVAPALVLVSSSPDVQLGAGIFELWQQSPTHNDPQLWIHAVDSNSAGNFRIDSFAPNVEIVNLSTTNAQGLGKWEPFASANGSARMQAGSSRCWDNTGFDNLAYWEPMSKGGGLYLQPFDSTGCESGAGYVASSQTIPIQWLTLNGHDVGLRGPDNTTASWTFRLPSTFSNGGQVLYQATSSTPRNWEFTTGGVAGNLLGFQGTSSAPVWTDISATSYTWSANQTFNSSVTIVGTGAGQIAITEGSTTTVTGKASGVDVLWADSYQHSLMMNNNNGSDYVIVGSSTTPVVGHSAVWSSTGALIDGGVAGSGGVSVYPATATALFPFGVNIGTNTIINGATFYYNAPIRMGGNNPLVASTLFINGGNSTGVGASNMMIGVANSQIGAKLATGSGNICIGGGTCTQLYSDVNGTFVGTQAGQASSGTTNSSFFGASAGFSNTSGISNTFIGKNSHVRNLTGNGNTSLGDGACDNLNLVSSQTASGQICLGAGSFLDRANAASIGSITFPIYDLFFNSPNQSANPGSSVTLHAQAGGGTDKAGGGFYVSAGQSTGNGAPGPIVLSISTSAATGSTTNALVQVASYTANGYSLLSNMHFNTINSTQPTLSSCGTGPTVIGTDSAFTITGGTGANGCVAAFTKPFTNVPTCVVSNQSMSVVNALSYTVAVTSITLTQTSMGTSKVDVVCTGHD